jgi:hypothetical protein
VAVVVVDVGSPLEVAPLASCIAVEETSLGTAVSGGRLAEREAALELPGPSCAP